VVHTALDELFLGTLIGTKLLLLRHNCLLLVAPHTIIKPTQDITAIEDLELTSRRCRERAATGMAQTPTRRTCHGIVSPGLGAPKLLIKLTGKNVNTRGTARGRVSARGRVCPLTLQKSGTSTESPMHPAPASGYRLS
jgi:hypothetical protein